MKKKLELRTETDADRTRISVRGDLDMDSSPQLLEAIRHGLKNTSGIAVELRDVGYIDSSGIAVLVHGFKLARKESLNFRIVDPSPQVMSVMQLSQLDQFFSIERPDAPE